MNEHQLQLHWNLALLLGWLECDDSFDWNNMFIDNQFARVDLLVKGKRIGYLTSKYIFT